MSTPFKILYNALNGRLNSSEISALDNTSKRKSFLENAIPDFEDYFKKLTVDYDNESITEDLTAKEKKFLALLMYKTFCEQDWNKWNGIANIISDSTKVTGLNDVRSAKEERLNKVITEINQLLATLV